MRQRIQTESSAASRATHCTATPVSPNARRTRLASVNSPRQTGQARGRTTEARLSDGDERLGRPQSMALLRE
jgi:hypothetical protein